MSWAGLQPYGEYSVVLSACTDVGCADSTEVSFRTAQAAPQGDLRYLVLF